VVGRAKREHPLLGPALLFVAPGAAEGRVEAVLVKRLLEALGLPHVGVQRRAVVEGVDAPRLGFRVLVDDQLKAQLLGHALAHLVHGLELPGRVHVHQREGRLAGIEGLGGQVQHHGAVLADRIQHHRAFALGGHLAHDVDALGLQSLQVGQAGGAEVQRGSH